MHTWIRSSTHVGKLTTIGVTRNVASINSSFFLVWHPSCVSNYHSHKQINMESLQWKEQQQF